MQSKKERSNNAIPKNELALANKCSYLNEIIFKDKPVTMDGFAAAVYVYPDNPKHIFIVFRGSKEAENWLKDNSRIALGINPPSEEKAIAFVKNAMAEFGDDYEYTITGFSLGSTLAINASLAVGKPVVAFDCPGQFNGDLGESARLVTVYQAPQNLVNQCAPDTLSQFTVRYLQFQGRMKEEYVLHDVSPNSWTRYCGLGFFLGAKANEEITHIAEAHNIHNINEVISGLASQQEMKAPENVLLLGSVNNRYFLNKNMKAVKKHAENSYKMFGNDDPNGICAAQLIKVCENFKEEPFVSWDQKQISQLKKAQAPDANASQDISSKYPENELAEINGTEFEQILTDNPTDEDQAYIVNTTIAADIQRIYAATYGADAQVRKQTDTFIKDMETDLEQSLSQQDKDIQEKKKKHAKLEKLEKKLNGLATASQLFENTTKVVNCFTADEQRKGQEDACQRQRDRKLRENEDAINLSNNQYRGQGVNQNFDIETLQTQRALANKAYLSAKQRRKATALILRNLRTARERKSNFQVIHNNAYADLQKTKQAIYDVSDKIARVCKTPFALALCQYGITACDILAGSAKDPVLGGIAKVFGNFLQLVNGFAQFGKQRTLNQLIPRAEALQQAFDANLRTSNYTKGMMELYFSQISELCQTMINTPGLYDPKAIQEEIEKSLGEVSEKLRKSKREFRKTELKEYNTYQKILYCENLMRKGDRKEKKEAKNNKPKHESDLHNVRMQKQSQRVTIQDLEKEQEYLFYEKTVREKADILLSSMYQVTNEWLPEDQNMQDAIYKKIQPDSESYTLNEIEQELDRLKKFKSGKFNGYKYPRHRQWKYLSDEEQETHNKNIKRYERVLELQGHFTEEDWDALIKKTIVDCDGDPDLFAHEMAEQLKIIGIEISEEELKEMYTCIINDDAKQMLRAEFIASFQQIAGSYTAQDNAIRGLLFGVNTLANNIFMTGAHKKWMSDQTAQYFMSGGQAIHQGYEVYAQLRNTAIAVDLAFRPLFKAYSSGNLELSLATIGGLAGFMTSAINPAIFATSAIFNIYKIYLHTVNPPRDPVLEAINSVIATMGQKFEALDKHLGKIESNLQGDIADAKSEIMGSLLKIRTEVRDIKEMLQAHNPVPLLSRIDVKLDIKNDLEQTNRINKQVQKKKALLAPHQSKLKPQSKDLLPMQFIQEFADAFKLFTQSIVNESNIGMNERKSLFELTSTETFGLLSNKPEDKIGYLAEKTGYSTLERKSNNPEALPNMRLLNVCLSQLILVSKHLETHKAAYKKENLKHYNEIRKKLRSLLKTNKKYLNHHADYASYIQRMDWLSDHSTHIAENYQRLLDLQSQKETDKKKSMEQSLQDNFKTLISEFKYTLTNEAIEKLCGGFAQKERFAFEYKLAELCQKHWEKNYRLLSLNSDFNHEIHDWWNGIQIFFKEPARDRGTYRLESQKTSDEAHCSLASNPYNLPFKKTAYQINQYNADYQTQGEYVRFADFMAHYGEIIYRLLDSGKSSGINLEIPYALPKGENRLESGIFPGIKVQDGILVFPNKELKDKQLPVLLPREYLRRQFEKYPFLVDLFENEAEGLCNIYLEYDLSSKKENSADIQIYLNVYELSLYASSNKLHRGGFKVGEIEADVAKAFFPPANKKIDHQKRIFEAFFLYLYGSLSPEISLPCSLMRPFAHHPDCMLNRNRGFVGAYAILACDTVETFSYRPTDLNDDMNNILTAYVNGSEMSARLQALLAPYLHEKKDILHYLASVVPARKQDEIYIGSGRFKSSKALIEASDKLRLLNVDFSNNSSDLYAAYKAIHDEYELIVANLRLVYDLDYIDCVQLLECKLGLPHPLMIRTVLLENPVAAKKMLTNYIALPKEEMLNHLRDILEKVPASKTHKTGKALMNLLSTDLEKDNKLNRLARKHAFSGESLKTDHSSVEPLKLHLKQLDYGTFLQFQYALKSTDTRTPKPGLERYEAEDATRIQEEKVRATNPAPHIEIIKSPSPITKSQKHRLTVPNVDRIIVLNDDLNDLCKAISLLVNPEQKIKNHTAIIRRALGYLVKLQIDKQNDFDIELPFDGLNQSITEYVLKAAVVLLGRSILTTTVKHQNKSDANHKFDLRHITDNPNLIEANPDLLIFAFRNSKTFRPLRYQEKMFNYQKLENLISKYQGSISFDKRIEYSTLAQSSVAFSIYLDALFASKYKNIDEKISIEYEKEKCSYLHLVRTSQHDVDLNYYAAEPHHLPFQIARVLQKCLPGHPLNVHGGLSPDVQLNAQNLKKHTYPIKFMTLTDNLVPAGQSVEGSLKKLTPEVHRTRFVIDNNIVSLIKAVSILLDPQSINARQTSWTKDALVFALQEKGIKPDFNQTDAPVILNPYIMEAAAILLRRPVFCFAEHSNQHKDDVNNAYIQASCREMEPVIFQIRGLNETEAPNLLNKIFLPPATLKNLPFYNEVLRLGDKTVTHEFSDVCKSSEAPEINLHFDLRSLGKNALHYQAQCLLFLRTMRFNRMNYKIHVTDFNGLESSLQIKSQTAGPCKLELKCLNLHSIPKKLAKMLQIAFNESQLSVQTKQQEYLIPVNNLDTNYKQYHVFNEHKLYPVIPEKQDFTLQASLGFFKPDSPSLPVENILQELSKPVIANLPTLADINNIAKKYARPLLVFQLESHDSPKLDIKYYADGRPDKPNSRSHPICLLFSSGKFVALKRADQQNNAHFLTSVIERVLEKERQSSPVI